MFKPGDRVRRKGTVSRTAWADLNTMPVAYADFVYVCVSVARFRTEEEVNAGTHRGGWVIDPDDMELVRSNDVALEVDDV